MTIAPARPALAVALAGLLTAHAASAAVMDLTEFPLKDLDYSSAPSTEGGEQPELRAAFIAMQRGDAPEAMRIVEDLIAAQPQNPLALEVLGGWYLERERFEAAEALLVRSAAVEARSSVMVKLGAARIGAGKLRQGEADVRQALASEPDNLLALRTLARLEARRGRSAQAIGHYRAMLGSDELQRARLTQVHIELAELLLRTGDGAGVLELVARALQEGAPDAERAQALRLASEAARTAGDHDAAVRYSVALDEVAGAQSAMAVTTAAKALYAAGREEDAMARMRAAATPDAPFDVTLLYGQALIATGEFAAAEAHLSRALAATDDPLRAELLMREAASAMFPQNRLADAVALAESTAERFPDNSGLGIAAASLLAATGDPQRALAAFDAMIERAPEDAELHFQRAQIRLQTGQVDPARGDLRRAVALEPGRADYWVLLAEVRAADGREAVRTTLDEALTHNPDSADLAYDRIALDEESVELEATVSAYQALVRDNPAHWASALRLAALLGADPSRRAEAAALVEQARRHGADDAQLTAASAWLDHLAGKSGNALSELTRLARNYRHPLVLYRIAAIHATLGRTERARTSARAALAAGLRGRERAHAAELAR